MISSSCSSVFVADLLKVFMGETFSLCLSRLKDTAPIVDILRNLKLLLTAFLNRATGLISSSLFSLKFRQLFEKLLPVSCMLPLSVMQESIFYSFSFCLLPGISSSLSWHLMTIFLNWSIFLLHNPIVEVYDVLDRDRLLTADIEIYFGDFESIEVERLLRAPVYRLLNSSSRFYSTVLLRFNIAFLPVPLLSWDLLCERIGCFIF